MPSPPVAAEPDALAPVRDALLALARRDAERVLASADADAAATLARAVSEAEQITSDAQAAAEADAAALLAAEQTRVNREARAVELRARRVAYEDLVRRAHEAVRALADDPGLRDTLADLARSALGADATVVSSPDGGVVAEAHGRRIAYPLAALADQAVADLIASREGT